MKRVFLILTLVLLAFPSLTPAQSQETAERENIYAVVKDGKGETLEGVLNFSSDELTLRSKDNQEKSIPLKYIKSITLEKNKPEIPGEDPKKATYSVRVENSQEIYTLKKKYTFSLNTNLGMITKTIDPDTVNNFFSRDSSQMSKPDNEKPFIQDKSVVFSLELKF